MYTGCRIGEVVSHEFCARFSIKEAISVYILEISFRLPF